MSKKIFRRQVRVQITLAAKGYKEFLTLLRDHITEYIFYKPEKNKNDRKMTVDSY